MNRKFKKGDKVRVCDIPPLNKKLFPTWETPGMDLTCGKEYTISYSEEGYYGLDNCNYVFNELWLEHARPKIPIVQTTDFGML